MDVEKVKELVELMKANDLSELEVVDGQKKIILKRGPDPSQVMVSPLVAPGNVSGSTSVSAVPADDSGLDNSVQSLESQLKEIPSPIVGTFYAAPSPNAGDFVKVGDPVGEDTVVCIVEAMKVMNEIKSEISGTVKKIMVENGSAVEFGQPLFLVEPD
jgi:acetyl-CoA carboxylase biotin carboxyl carrier protein